jgi:hypothetical protein
MKIKTSIIDLRLRGPDASQTILEFIFSLEDDDHRDGITNTGKTATVSLSDNRARFYFPIAFSAPHPDLCALAALKIISPFIGSNFEMDRPVSHEMAEVIRHEYPNIKTVSSADILPRQAPLRETPVVSFSGGADSIAAAALLPPDTPLIHTARVFHPVVGEFERWYSAKPGIGSLWSMPRSFRKVPVFTDFEYLVTNGKYCILPDSYAIAIPAILLADHFGTTHIVTGDIWAAFTGDETTCSLNVRFPKAALFTAVGLAVEYPCNGLSEFGTLKINHIHGLNDIASTCVYGDFQRPCMRCIKCFRKSLFQAALGYIEFTDAMAKRFNENSPVQAFADNTSRGGLAFAPSFKFAFSKVPGNFGGAIGAIKDRAYSAYGDIDPSFVTKYLPVYEDRPHFIIQSHREFSEFIAPMSERELSIYSSIDYRRRPAAPEAPSR